MIVLTFLSWLRLLMNIPSRFPLLLCDWYSMHFCAISSCQNEAEDNAQLCKLLVTCLESLPSHYPRLTRSTKQAVAASRRRTEQGTSPEFNPAIPITHHLEDFMRSSMLGPWVCFGRTRVKQLFLEKVPSHSSPDCTSPQNSIEWNCTIKAVEFF